MSPTQGMATAPLAPIQPPAPLSSPVYGALTMTKMPLNSSIALDTIELTPNMNRATIPNPNHTSAFKPFKSTKKLRGKFARGQRNYYHHPYRVQQAKLGKSSDSPLFQNDIASSRYNLTQENIPLSSREASKVVLDEASFSNLNTMVQIAHQTNSLPLNFDVHMTSVSSPLETQQKHQQKGGKRKRPECETCAETFCDRSALKKHKLTHTGEKPFQCGTCSKRFSRNEHLQKHARIHTGEKPFACTVCDRRFRQKSTLSTHMRTHTHERPHKCSQCNASFAQKSNLRRHICSVHK
jgi:uncharacterized Zn-finger protein